MEFYSEACEDVERWQAVINDCDAEIKCINESGATALEALIVKIALAFITFLVLVSIVATTSGCNAVAGLGEDITWTGRAGQEMLEHGHESMNR